MEITLPAAHQSVLEGTTYAFCSAEHKATFDADPARFASSSVAAPAHDPGKPTMRRHVNHAMHHGSHGRSGTADEHQHDHEGHKGHDHGSHHAHMIADFRKRFVVSTLLTIPILVLSPMLQEWLGLATRLRFAGDLYLLFALSTIVFVYGGYPFLSGFWKEVRSARPGMMTLIAVAITTAYGYSSLVVFGWSGKIFFWELATLVDIMLLGHWIEMRSVMGASRALEELAKLMPAIAHKVMPDGSMHDVPLEDLTPGDLVLVKPGEKIPADGAVTEGSSFVNEAMLTGESRPVRKQRESAVIGGAINGEGSLTVKVQKTGSDSFLAQVVDLVRQAQKSKSRTQDLANRAALWLTFVALGSGAVTLFAWLAILHQNFAFALERTVTVMVIACPHALGLAVPLVVAVSTALSARNGLLIRNRAAFERARNIQAIIFDKTGTLTNGTFGITDTVVLKGSYTVKEVVQLAASIESRSEHPIARAIASIGDKLLPVEGFHAIPGKGAEGSVSGKNVKVVSPGYLAEMRLEADDNRVNQLLDEGKTVVFVVVADEVVGAIALADTIRRESRAAIATLKAAGIRCLMLTGDNRKVASWVAKEIGIDEVLAEVLPQDKSNKVREVQSRGLTVAMTGDGVNDAPALAQADVGIAIGAGTDVAIETADIVLVRGNPLDVVSVIELARATYSKMVQNLVWATGYNALAIPLAAGVLWSYGILLSPAVGAVLMSLSTIIVAANARFLKIRTHSRARRNPA